MPDDNRFQRVWIVDAAGNIVSNFSGGGGGGVTVRGVRSRPIPTNIVSLLLQGVYDLFAGSANGVVVGLTAAEETPTTV